MKNWYSLLFQLDYKVRELEYHLILPNKTRYLLFLHIFEQSNPLKGSVSRPRHSLLLINMDLRINPIVETQSVWSYRVTPVLDVKYADPFVLKRVNVAIGGLKYIQALFLICTYIAVFV